MADSQQSTLADGFEALVEAAGAGAGAFDDALAAYENVLRAEVAAERRRRLSAPRMALRPHGIEDWDGLDDVVVEHPTMFRAEFMHENELWMCCYFPEPHDRITFHVKWDRQGKRLVLHEGEMPSDWIDIDKERKNAHAQ